MLTDVQKEIISCLLTTFQFINGNYGYNNFFICSKHNYLLYLILTKYFNDSSKSESVFIFIQKEFRFIDKYYENYIIEHTPILELKIPVPYKSSSEFWEKFYYEKFKELNILNCTQWFTKLNLFISEEELLMYLNKTIVESL